MLQSFPVSLTVDIEADDTSPFDDGVLVTLKAHVADDRVDVMRHRDRLDEDSKFKTAAAIASAIVVEFAALIQEAEARD